ncbi:MAG: class I SAM-dependent methyltransferase [Deltaproteobacteria bacterium]|nr:MAG: class I SAM-dependent methyltransferase [Deltaproteobacteria bacterium]
MGFYADHIFPRLMDWTLRGPVQQSERGKALQSVRGDVLEVGFGTGLNLRHYPPGVTRLTAIDVADMLQLRVARRIAAVPFPVERAQLSGDELPFPDGRFDCVVTTFTLCSIKDPVAALRQIRRVLKPEGTYVFLEHGRSDDERVARRQDFFNPLQRRVACGCNINRRIDALIREAGLEVRGLERYALGGIPRIMAEMYRGTARRME